MDTPALLQLLLGVGGAALSALLAVAAARYRTHPGVTAAMALLSAVSVLVLAAALQPVIADARGALFCARVGYSALTVAPVAFILFVAAYTSNRRMTRARRLLFAIVPATTLLLLWTDAAHGWMFRGTPPPLGAANRAAVAGPWFWVHTVYSYSLLLGGMVVIVVAWVRASAMYRPQLTLLLVGCVAPLVANLLLTLDVITLPQTLASFSYVWLGAFFAWSLLRHHMFDLAPVARDVLLDDMDDGVALLDGADRVVELNAAMRLLFAADIAGQDPLGKPMAEALGSLASLIAGLPGDRAAQTEICLMHGGRCHYDVRLTPLAGRRGETAGRLLVLRDITERVEAEAALQAAHEALQREKQRADALLDIVIPIGADLVSERDYDRLLERMLAEAQQFAHASSGVLYLVDGEGLRPAAGQAGRLSAPLPLFDENGAPDTRPLANRAVHSGEPVATGHLSGSDEAPDTLAIPLRTDSGVAGVLVLRDPVDPRTGAPAAFDAHMQELLVSFSTLANAALRAYLREQSLRREIKTLQIQIDRQKADARLSEITSTEYFQMLKARAAELRRRRKAERGG